MTVRTAEGDKTFRFPYDINGFEYQIREVSRCVRQGKTHSDLYSPDRSVALTRQMQEIRESWNMKFDGEE